jgi:hypothetical protein
VAGAAVVAAESKTVVAPLRVMLAVSAGVVMLRVADVDRRGVVSCAVQIRQGGIRTFRVSAERHCH